MKDIRAWLLGTYVPIGRYETAVQARLDGTFDWFLERKFFLNWSSRDFPNSNAKVLWVNGPPGFGKTVLCARVVQHLSFTPDSPLAYFFFSSDDSESRRDPFLAMRSWLTQLLPYSSAFEVVRKESESESQTSLIASRAHVVAMFKTIVQNIPGCTFILDGIDECIGVGSAYDMEDRSVTTFLESVQQAIANTTTRLLIVSRTIAEVRQSFIRNAGMTYFDYTLSCDDNQADIKLYARDIVDKKLQNKDATIKNNISTKLAERCNGQFLWVKLQESSLRSSRNKKQLEAVIDRTPAALDQLYDRDWQRLRSLPTDECTRAVSLLRWAAFAIRPLTVAEITEALLISDNDEFPADEMPDSIDQDYVDGEILGLCGSLIEIRDATSDSNVDSMTVHLAHFSVKEFFVSRISATEGTVLNKEHFFNSNEVVQNGILAISCLRYLKLRGIWQDDDEQSCHIPRQFLNYAAGSWQEHAAESRSGDSEAFRLTNEFLSENNEAWKSWRKWYYETNRDDDRRAIVADKPLHFAALFRLTATVQFLIETKKCDLNQRTTWGETALHISCIIGDTDTVAALQTAGADIATANKYEETPLVVACKEGHFAIVKLLLEHGVQRGATATGELTPLNLASNGSHATLVKLFLKNEAQIAAKTVSGFTPLHWASNRGHNDVVEILLQKGADAAAITTTGYTPLQGYTSLHLAANRGFSDVVATLLRHGANPHTASPLGWTALHQASKQGFVEVVELLLKSEASVTDVTINSWTPLHLACVSGHSGVVGLLLENGADATAVLSDGRTSLYLATSRGHTDIARILLKRGVNPNTVHLGQPVLSAACEQGYYEMAKLFLEYGSDVSAKDSYGQTPLHMAANHGTVEMVELLLRQGALADATDSFWRSALFYACAEGRTLVVECLLSHNASNALRDRYGTSPLCAATRNGHNDIVTRLLCLEDGDDCFVDGLGKTLVWWATQSGSTQVVETIVEFAVTHGLPILDDDLQGAESVPTRHELMYCDCCVRKMPRDDVRYHCLICRDGDFDLCQECFEMGVGCNDDAHELVLIPT